MLAALDQSGGSTPAALAQYGVNASEYKSEEELFEQIHQMRLRVMKSPAFAGDRILAVILFKRTLQSRIEGRAIPDLLFEKGRIASLLKIDVGLEQAVHGAQLMQPIPDLAQTLRWARSLGVIGTKMRSLIHDTTQGMVVEAVRQQFALAEEIFAAGLLPIVEIEVSTALPDDVRRIQELQLRTSIASALEQASEDLRIFLKLTIPVTAGLYTPLMRHAKVYRVLALSGGFSRHYACQQLAQNPGMIASFSRALLEDLRAQMPEAEFNRMLDRSMFEVLGATKNRKDLTEQGSFVQERLADSYSGVIDE
nr:fructose-bisphosphate aldolase [Granulicella aggregans]